MPGRQPRSEERIAQRVLEHHGNIVRHVDRGDAQRSHDLVVRLADGSAALPVEVTMATNPEQHSFAKAARATRLHATGKTGVMLSLPPNRRLSKLQPSVHAWFTSCVAGIEFVPVSDSTPNNTAIRSKADDEVSAQTAVQREVDKPDNTQKLAKGGGGGLFVLIHQSLRRALREVCLSTKLDWAAQLPDETLRLWVGPALCSRPYPLWLFTRCEGWSKCCSLVDFKDIDPYGQYELPVEVTVVAKRSLAAIVGADGRVLDRRFEDAVSGADLRVIGGGFRTLCRSRRASFLGTWRTR